MAIKPYLDVRKRISETPIAVIDFETTGLVPGIDAVCQVAIVRIEGRKLTEQATSWINPGIEIPEEATKVHGLTDDMVKDSPTLAEFFADSAHVIDGAWPAAFNAPFDSRFMPPGVVPHDWPWLCILALCRLNDGSLRGSHNWKLDVACARHGIKLEGAHNAEADTLAAARLMHKLLSKGRDSSMADLITAIEVKRIGDWANFHEWLSNAQERNPRP